MSEAARQNLKVSREGIVLIKSFEGFRPRAIQRENGGWIIGYGHTLSAREGASVSEADAELLLRYDLMPVEKALNDTVPSGLNQHQFDALVSFAFSVGVDDFAGSDVRQRLNAGSPGEAADAMMGWPEPALPETALRRRAAERALFVANPSTPVALSDLLSAPLPPPAVIVPIQDPAAEPIVEPELVIPFDPRGAAVAALLGEPAARILADEPEPAEIPISVDDEVPVPSNDNPAVEIVSDDAAPEEPAAELLPVETAPAAILDVPPPAPTEAAADEERGADTTPPTPPSPTPSNTPSAVFSAARYAPYNLAMVGPLPYLQPASPKAEPAETDAPSIDHSVVETAPAPIKEPAVEPVPEAIPETAEAIDAASTAVEAPPVEPMAYVAPVPVVPAYVATVDAAPIAELVLTPLDDVPEPAIERPMWTMEERDAPDGSETNLFGEDLTLTLGGSVMRHEIEFEAPARFDWSETGPFIFMGGVGLVSFGASMAAFRRAAEQSGGGDLTIIGWVLALIGLACVGVSSVNLYRKFGLPGGD